nr:MAG TPA: hypothetical protein [Caudoviricetes sp.]
MASISAAKSSSLSVLVPRPSATILVRMVLRAV